MVNKIPESIIKRSKQAYRAPIKSAFFLKNSPDYVQEMLSPSCFNKAGVFNFDSVSKLLLKIEKTGASSEVDDMVMSSVISTHLLYYQFIEKHFEDLPQGRLKNLKIVDDIKM